MANRKYEALTSFLRGQNTESLFVETLDSNVSIAITAEPSTLFLTVSLHAK